MIHVPLLCEYNTGSPIKLQYMCATKGAIRCPAKHKPLTNETKKKKATQTQENVYWREWYQIANYSYIAQSIVRLNEQWREWYQVMII